MLYLCSLTLFLSHTHSHWWAGNLQKMGNNWVIWPSPVFLSGENKFSKDSLCLFRHRTLEYNMSFALKTSTWWKDSPLTFEPGLSDYCSRKSYFYGPDNRVSGNASTGTLPRVCEASVDTLYWWLLITITYTSLKLVRSLSTAQVLRKQTDA